MIFSILGYLALELNVPITEVINGGGVELAFISYPTAVGTFETAPQLFSVLFFLMLITLGMGSATGSYTNIVGVICDQFNTLNRTVVTAAVLSIGFLTGMVYITPGGQQVLDLVDFFVSRLIVPVLAVLEVSGACYIYGLGNIIRDINFMLDRNLGIYWKFCWGILIPLTLSFSFLYFVATFPEIEYGGVSYPTSAVASGWILAAIAWITVPIGMIYAFVKSEQKEGYAKLCDICLPSKLWGPQDTNEKNEWVSLSWWSLSWNGSK